MIIYSTKIWLIENDITPVLEPIATYLSRRIDQPISPQNLLAEFRIENATKTSRLLIERNDDEFPISLSFRLTELDRSVKGKQWITEIGLNKETSTSEIEVSFLLETLEVSSRVSSVSRAARPYVINELLERCKPSKKTAGITIQSLHENNADDLWVAIDNPERLHTIVIISPTFSGDYVVSPGDLLSQLGGIADVYQIETWADTRQIEDILTTRYACWDGAINIIFPRKISKDQGASYSRRLLARQVEQFYDEYNHNPAREILSIICHRVNLLNKGQHISPQKVKTQSLRRKIEQGQSTSSGAGTNENMEAFYKEYSESLQSEIEAIKTEKSQLEEEINALEEELETKIILISNLKRQLSEYKASLHHHNAQISDNKMPDAYHNALLNVINSRINGTNTSLEAGLLLLEFTFPDRVLILESAKVSANESKDFSRGSKAFDLLWRLATDYWDMLDEGKGDTEAKGVFGDTIFAGNESESARKNKKATKLRTYTYKGQEIKAFKHLRIGVKDSTVDTLRIYFHWDSDDKKIVIAHCGKHLDLK